MSHGSIPPFADDFTLSSVPKPAVLVWVRVTPVVGFPFGSSVARKNSIRVSAIRPLNTPGTMLVSGLVARKSRFSTSIWLSIWACEMFCALVFQTTWTTQGMRAIPANRCCAAT